MSKPILYTTHCPMCGVLTKKLNQYKIEYQSCTDESVMDAKGITHVPMLEIDGKLLNLKESLQWAEDNKCI